jgi:hypothetical protein
VQIICFNSERWYFGYAGGALWLSPETEIAEVMITTTIAFTRKPPCMTIQLE